MITPTSHEKAEWARLAQNAYHQDRNDLGHRFSAAAARGQGEQMPVQEFNALQNIYRAWLVWNRLPNRCIRCNTNYTATTPCTCGARASLRNNRSAS